jgi:ribonuclease BN (tRNA processing enzyme)
LRENEHGKDRIVRMRLQVLGSGDAFGSGGRLNTCFFVDRGDASFLVDCGASAMISIRRFEIDPNRIGAIFLSHLHGDHFGGLPFFVLDAQLVSRRARPLVIVGPKGLQGRFHALTEACFPGSSRVERKFAVEFVEIEPSAPAQVAAVGAEVTGYLVKHPSETPSMGLRVECDGRTIAYTGDTEWVENIVRIGRGADVLLAEAYWYERKVPFHLDFLTLKDRLPMIGAKRVVLTHMSPDMLARPAEELFGCKPAYDGLILDLDQKRELEGGQAPR